MTVARIDPVTGEVLDVMTPAEARRLTTEAQAEFRSAVAHHDRGWQIVAQAVRAGGHEALGYHSASDYVEHEFAEALSALDAPGRRIAVLELTKLGLSTRAIAPVVGVHDSRVRQIRREVGNDYPPEPEPDPAPDPESLDAYRHRTLADAEATHKIVKLTGAQSVADPTPAPAPAPKIIGRDGKTYTRPEPKPLTLAPAPARDYDQENAEQHCAEFANALDVLWSMTFPEAFDRSFKDWERGAIGARPSARRRRTPNTIRAIADALNAYADRLEASQ